MLENILRGLDVLRDYFATDNKYTLNAKHNIIYVYPTDEPVDENDFYILQQLGWFQQGKASNSQFTEYDPEKGWQHLT